MVPQLRLLQGLIRNYGEDDFVNLHSHLLGLVLGKKGLVRPVREALVAYRLIDCDRRYVVDHKSFGYRIGPKLQGVPWTHYHAQDRRFLKRVERFKDWVRQPQGFSVPVHQHLAFWVQKVELPDPLPDIDFQVAEPGRISKGEVAMHQVEMIRQRLVHVSVCNYGRFHSNFTGLCREIRQNLLINSVSLVEIDIVNSQPYFLSLLLLEICLTSRNMPNFSSFLWKRGRERALPYVSPFLGVLGEVPEDLGQFALDTAQGSFYEKFLPLGNWTRDELKPRIFQILYGDRKVMTNSVLTEAFRHLYPTVFAMTLDIKAKKGFEWVGRELQRRESLVVINGVCEALRSDHPEVPIITIHDSLLTTREHLPLVQQLLHDHFSQFPVSPQFRIKGERDQ